MSRINTNVTSMIAARVLNTQQTAMNKALERLSTGLRINSGADDPAGLIASEVLRGEKTAIEAAISNGERASNIIATAEGALNQVSALLTQLEDLVSSAANEGGLSEDEVAAKQLQVDSILESINRIANSTEFEGVKLLDGSMDYTTSGTNLSAFDDVVIKSARLADGATKQVIVQIVSQAELAQVGGASGIGSQAVTLQITGNRGTEIFSFAASTAASAIVAAVNQATDFTGVSARLSGGRVYFNSTEYGSDKFVNVQAIDGSYGGTGIDYGDDAVVKINGQTATADGLTVKLNTSTLSIDLTLDSAASGTKTFHITGGGADFALAADVLTGLASIGIQSITTGNLGSATEGMLSSLASGQTNNLSSGNLGTAQRIVKAAIRQVASIRGRLGAFKKLTIDSTVESLKVTLENTAAAESAIRDADFATETANLTRSQILVQAATSVLRQANLAPQNVLALLS